MSVRILIERLVASGVSAIEAAEIVAEAAILGAGRAAKDPAAEKRRAYDRERKRKSGGIPVESGGTPPETAERPSRTRVVKPTSSLRSEDIPPTHPSGAPPAKPKRSRSCPDDWSPDDRLTGWAAGEGFTPGEIERELAKFRDHEFRDPHGDWPKAFRNWLRKSRQFGPRLIHERPHPDDKLSRKEANLARAFASAERAAGQRWEP